MMNDTLTPVSWRARPRSFVALMGLYESNYIRLGWLAGELACLTGAHRSFVPGDCDLLLSVTERTPYTSTLTLTYQMPGPEQPREYPDISVRIYHDVRLAEAREWAAPFAPEGVRGGPAERELEQRWARNIMLNKWLEYCAERGHRFAAPAAAPRRALPG
jgi:uncharacterized protein